MRICSIASGSSGNCIYVGSDATHLLVDAGISGKRTELGLAELGICGKDIDGILITHEHIDHVQGLGVLARRYGIPIFGTKGTLQALKKVTSIGKIEDELLNEIEEDAKFLLKDITINSMKISHDAAQPVAYRFAHDNKKAAVITDLGTFNNYIIESLKDMDAILIEANHDVRMLQVGAYPYYLKKRILGERGHLSNEDSGRLLSELLHDNMKQIILGHLSQENNMAELAYETVRLEIANGSNPYKADDFPIQVANRSIFSQVIAI